MTDLTAAHESRDETTVKRINAAIQHTGLEIVRGTGYQYFLNSEGDQVGDSVMVCYLNQLSLDQWAVEAQYALNWEGV